MGLYALNDEDRAIFQETANLRKRPSLSNQYKRRRTSQGGTGGPSTSTTTQVALDTVLIDQDIKGALDFDLPKMLTVEDVRGVATGYEDIDVVFQDPPDDTDYTNNIITEFPLWAYRRRPLRLKKMIEFSETLFGIAVGGSANTIILDTDASHVKDFYKGDFITLDTYQVLEVLSYNQATRTATMVSNWDTPPSAGVSIYSIPILNSWELDYIVKDRGSYGDNRVVQYVYIDVFYEDGEPFTRDSYDRSDYPDLDENIQSLDDLDLPDGYLKKRYRAKVLNKVLLMRTCKELPPPSLEAYLP